MSSFLSIKDWLTLDEAIEYLGDKLNANTSRSELISLVKEDHKINLTAKIPVFTAIDLSISGLFTTPQKILPKFKSQIITTFVHLNILNDIKGFNFLTELEILGCTNGCHYDGIYQLVVPVFFAKKENPIEINYNNGLLDDYHRFKQRYQIDTTSSIDVATDKESDLLEAIGKSKVYGLIKVHYKGSMDDYGFIYK